MEMEVQESDPEHFYGNRSTAMSAVVNDYVLGEKCHCNQLKTTDFTGHTVTNNNTRDPDCAMGVGHLPY
jgi:hypothetical protein